MPSSSTEGDELEAAAEGGSEPSSQQKQQQQQQPEEDFEMNACDRRKLLRCRKAIVDDLESYIVTDLLMQERILDAQALQLIEAEVRKDQII